MYKGLVFDEVRNSAFLSIANKEGLISERGMSDGIYGRAIRINNISHELAESVFEQMIIAGRVFVNPGLYKYMQGELIDNGFIKPYDNNKDETFDFISYDIDTVLRMLKEKGYGQEEYTEKRVREEFADIYEKAIEVNRIEKDSGINQWTEVTTLTGLNPNGVDVSPLKHYSELRKGIIHSPVYRVLSEYREVLNIAYKNSLLCSVTNTNNSIQIDNVDQMDNALNLFKYTEKSSHKIYTASKLKDNVRLAETEEAKGLRKQISLWINRLSTGEFDEAEKIKREIAYAQKALRSEKIVDSINWWNTTFSLPVYIFSNLPGKIGQMFKIIGIIQVLSGAGTQLSLKVIKEKYLWASYGLGIN